MRKGACPYMAHVRSPPHPGFFLSPPPWGPPIR